MKYNFFIIISLLKLVYSEQWDYFIPSLGYPPGRNINTKFAIDPKFTNILQKLDHFDLSNNKTWLMQMQYNDQFFKPNGPLFIMLGGEQPITSTVNWLQMGQMFDMAKEHGAYMLYTEHRFYGRSRPTSDLSIESLKYLTTEQAIADVIQVIRTYKKDLLSNKVVVFGGSYAGNMAIWLREKYPNDVYAAVSSSAPVLAKADFYEYHEMVQEILGPICSAAIKKGIDQIRMLLGTPEGLQQIQKDFGLCQPLDIRNPLDIMYFFSVLSTYFGSIVQYATNNSVSKTCNELLYPNTADEYSKLLSLLNKTLGSKCRKNYYDMRAFFSNPNSNTNKRQWLYQTCTQFGYFQTTSKTQLYGNSHPIEMYYSWCRDFFGTSFTPTILQTGIASTNLIYGGINPNVTRVVSIHGTADPWFKLGISKDLNPLAPVIIINGTSHCEDLYSLSENDSPELKQGKILVKNYVRKWLKDN